MVRSLSITLALASAVLCSGCHRTGTTAPVTPAARPVAIRSPAARPRVPGTAPLPIDLDREQLTRSILDGLKKRIRGRRESLTDIDRIATSIGPIVVAAAQQPAAIPGLRAYAADCGVSLDDARTQWVRMQEADLLLESGGDPDAVSSAHAVGVAQWLAGTARANGLAVDLAASNRLTLAINSLRLSAAWISYLERPDANRSAPGAPRYNPADAAGLPGIHARIEALRETRRKIDLRYDPARAIFAQTRYLLRLYPRFPDPQWLYQAYHGGEAGVRRTLAFYLGLSWKGTVASAILHGDRGRRLSFEEVYLTSTPRSHSTAFDYLYGRSDDHRHYWWKLRASEEAIEVYRSDPAAFRGEWESYFPGRMTDVYWYPEAAGQSMRGLTDLTAAVHSETLVAVPSSVGFVVRPAPYDSTNAAWYAAVRPASLGALLIVADAYQRSGGTGPLQVGDLATTEAYRAEENVVVPPPPAKEPVWPPEPDDSSRPGGGPPRSFDSHTAGIPFDLLRPTDKLHRKILEYALSCLEDRRVVVWTDVRDRFGRRYHIVPNPEFRIALEAVALAGRTPSLAGL